MTGLFPRMNTRPFALLLAVACLFLAGCLPESKNPLSTPAGSLFDPHLEGVYQQRETDEVAFWHFRYRRENRGQGHEHDVSPWIDVLTAGHSKDGSLERSRYEALVTQIGGANYLSFISLPSDGAKKRPVRYSFARYAVNSRGDLRIWLAHESAFVAAVKAGKLRGKVTPHKFGDSVEITDPTPHLAAFLAASDPQTLFAGKPMVLRRVAR